MSFRVCFEEEYVARTLQKSKKKDLAIIDTDGISKAVIKAAVDRGVFVYGYMNAGAIEKERSYYPAYKPLRIAKYDGWSGEYWIDPTAQEWQQHLCDLAEDIKAAGAIGLYFDNTDIYYMISRGFKDPMREVPAKAEAYKALANVINTIQNDIGMIVMPNGGDVFVRKFMCQYPGAIRTIIQEGALYEDFKKQPSAERRYLAEWMDWAKEHGAYIRGIEYCKKLSQIAEAKAYYLKHGWQGLYVSKHAHLKGD